MAKTGFFQNSGSTATTENDIDTQVTLAETAATNAQNSATAAASSASAASASAQAASDSADAAARIGGKDIPTSAPTNSVLLKFSSADDAWVYSSEIDAGTFS